MTEALIVERVGAAVHITLNRPEARNALDNRMGVELLATLQDVAVDDEVRSVLLAGAGKAFCAGADLTAKRELTPTGHQDLGRRLRERTNPTISTIRLMDKPVVVAVQGPAVGIGCSMALAGDFILASESARFVLGFSKVGLAFDGGASALLPARVGLTRATELAMLGDPLPADKALDYGLVNEVVPDDVLRERAKSLVAALAEGPSLSYRNIKRALNEAVFPRFAEQLELEAQLQQEQAESHDFAEALVAFREKRDPVWEGR